MYRKRVKHQLSFEDFDLPFGGRLSGDNRWVRLAERVPWELVDEIYEKNFASANRGAPAKPSRMAFGALLIKERLGTSDEETVEQIRENPYLQFFLGLHGFQDEAPFDPSMFVHFRKRFRLEDLNRINEAIALAAEDEDPPASSGSPDTPASPGGNRGQLLLDATCAPADIRYPTDLSLLNEAREKSEEIIDTLFAPLRGTMRKPRTDRKKARKAFLAFTKNRKRGAKKQRKAVGRQLRYLRRNLATIDALCEQVPLTLLSRRQYRDLLVIREVYRQQSWMYEHRCHRIPDRIVSIHQPHVRPIVRGKASAPTEFGSKLSASLVDGMVFLDRLDWNPYNEAGDLIAQVEAYRRRYGHYPASVHADKIYRTRANRKYCKERGIRLSGPPLGRPVQEAALRREQARQCYQDEVDRIPIEGKFGQAKRRFGLGRIMARLAATSEAAIAMTFIVMNLEKLLKLLLLVLLTLIGLGKAHGSPLKRLFHFLTGLTAAHAKHGGIGHQCVAA